MAIKSEWENIPSEVTRYMVNYIPQQLHAVCKRNPNKYRIYFISTVNQNSSLSLICYQIAVKKLADVMNRQLADYSF